MIDKEVSGFTLIELMIVVSIVAILTAIAVPNYMQYLLQSRRSDAYSAILDIQSRMQTCYAQTGSYCNIATGATSNSLQYAAALPLITQQGYYSVNVNTIGVTTPSSYMINATVVSTNAQKADSSCYVIGIDDKGIRHSFANGSSTDTYTYCWQ